MSTTTRISGNVDFSVGKFSIMQLDYSTVTSNIIISEIFSLFLLSIIIVSVIMLNLCSSVFDIVSRTIIVITEYCVDFIEVRTF